MTITMSFTEKADIGVLCSIRCFGLVAELGADAAQAPALFTTIHPTAQSCRFSVPINSAMAARFADIRCECDIPYLVNSRLAEKDA